jgi:hypothetical protein
VALWTEAREVYRDVGMSETRVLTMPWAPRIDVIVLPRNFANVSGGMVRILARVPGAEIEIASAAVIPPNPLRLSAAAGCESYVVQASLMFTNPAGAAPVDTYVYARVHHG